MNKNVDFSKFRLCVFCKGFLFEPPLLKIDKNTSIACLTCGEISSYLEAPLPPRKAVISIYENMTGIGYEVSEKTDEELKADHKLLFIKEVDVLYDFKQSTVTTLLNRKFTIEDLKPGATELQIILVRQMKNDTVFKRYCF